jgi:hypothetical protein
VAPNGLLAACIAADEFWPSLPNVLCQSYESIAADPSVAVKAIAEHLRVEITSFDTGELSFEFPSLKNKERADALAAELAAGGVDLAQSENSLKLDSQTLIH